MLSQATFFAAEYYEQASKRPYGPFGAKPDMLSVVISIVKLLDAEALARFAMPTWGSVFIIIFLYFLTYVDALANIAKPERVSASNGASILMNAEAMFGC